MATHTNDHTLLASMLEFNKAVGELCKCVAEESGLGGIIVRITRLLESELKK